MTGHMERMLFRASKTGGSPALGFQADLTHVGQLAAVAYQQHQLVSTTRRRDVSADGRIRSFLDFSSPS